MKKDERPRFWVCCDNQNEYEKIKELSNKEGLSMGDYCRMKVLGLKVIIEEEIKEYPMRKKDKEGKDYGYTQKRILTKKVLIPA